MWDNHEFSWRGYQGVEKFGKDIVWGQTRKVAANQAWFEFQPSRAKQAGTLQQFVGPKVVDAPVTVFDEHGMGREPNNLAAVDSLIGYRALRFGKNVELILTDQHSYRSEDPSDQPGADNLGADGFPVLWPEEFTEILDAGRAYNGGHPPEMIDKGVPNFRKDSLPVTMLAPSRRPGSSRLEGLESHMEGLGRHQRHAHHARRLPEHPGRPYQALAGRGLRRRRRGRLVRLHHRGGPRSMTSSATTRSPGFATVSGDRHSFWAGLAAKALPPKAFEPVGVAFITGSISAPGMAESLEHNTKIGPLQSLFIVDRPAASRSTRST